MQPVIQFYENDSSILGTGTPITSGNPISFAGAYKGTVTNALPTAAIHIWNDKDGTNGSNQAVSVSLTVTPVNPADGNNPIFTGTAINGYQPMIEAQSVDAVGCVADSQLSFVSIGKLKALGIGNIPRQGMRVINLRLNVPPDAADVSLVNLNFQVNFNDMGS